MKFANPMKKDRTVTSTRGHAIRFPGKGSVPAESKDYEVVEGLVFVHTPSNMLGDVRAAGLVPREEIEDEPKGNLSQRPADVLEVEKQIFEAFAMLVEAGRREDFGANAAPKVKAVEKLVGWDITNAELRDFWNKFQAVGRDE